MANSILRQLSNTANTRAIQLHQIATLHITFACDAAFSAPIGTPVKLDSTGAVVVATPTDKPIGIVHINKNTFHSGKPCVGILTEFKAEIIGIAQSAITSGMPVAINSVTPDAVKFQPAAAGQYVVGVALESAAAGADVTVGVLTVSYKM